jgi:hypothetical protein
MSSLQEKWSDKYKKSIDCNNPKGFSQRAHCQGRKKKMSEEKKDHEYSMARSELKTVASAVKRLQKKMGKKGEGNLQAWVQSKITKAADYIDTAADYVTNEETKSGDSSLRDWFSKSRSSDGTPGWVQLGGKYAGKPCAKQPGQTTKPKCGSSKMKRNLSKDEEEAAFRRKNRKDPNPDRKGKAINVKTEEAMIEAAGEKDACYHKVKSRYKVWPSAYASGALVKCRKKGAANWGNKTKKEEIDLGEKCWPGYEKKGMKKMFGKKYPNCVKKEGYEFSNWRDDFKATEYEFIDLIKPEPWKSVKEECGVQRYCPKCKKNELRTECKYGGHYWDMFSKPASLAPETPEDFVPSESSDGGGDIGEAVRVPQRTGNIIVVTLSWRGKFYMIKLFFPQITKPSRKVNTYYVTDYKPGEQLLYVSEEEVDEDWQSVNRKDKTDGLSQKAVDAYRRENPGSKLKTAVTKKPSKLKAGSKDAKRRKSFCSRMSGMKKRLTSAKTARDPDSRINKALRRWNCN